MKPIIALTCDIDEESRIRLLQSYCDAIRIGGGTPIIIPPTTDKEEIAELLQQTNAKGVILTGGADIDPTFFNEGDGEGAMLGLRKYPDKNNGETKPVWELYRQAGTEKEDEAFAPLLNVIGIPNWNIIEPF